jgi:hypothetical protein
MTGMELVARMGKEKNLCRILAGKSESTIPLGSCRRRWEENIELPQSSEKFNQLQSGYQWYL